MTTFIARASYTAQDTDELSFAEGDRILVHSKDDDGWWYCEKHADCGGGNGFVPYTYLLEQGTSTVTNDDDAEVNDEDDVNNDSMNSDANNQNPSSTSGVRARVLEHQRFVRESFKTGTSSTNADVDDLAVFAARMEFEILSPKETSTTESDSDTNYHHHNQTPSPNLPTKDYKQQQKQQQPPHQQKDQQQPQQQQQQQKKEQQQVQKRQQEQTQQQQKQQQQQQREQRQQRLQQTKQQQSFKGIQLQTTVPPNNRKVTIGRTSTTMEHTHTDNPTTTTNNNTNNDNNNNHNNNNINNNNNNNNNNMKSNQIVLPQLDPDVAQDPVVQIAYAKATKGVIDVEEFNHIVSMQRRLNEAFSPATSRNPSGASLSPTLPLSLSPSLSHPSSPTSPSDNFDANNQMVSNAYENAARSEDYMKAFRAKYPEAQEYMLASANIVPKELTVSEDEIKELRDSLAAARCELTEERSLHAAQLDTCQKTFESRIKAMHAATHAASVKETTGPDVEHEAIKSEIRTLQADLNVIGKALEASEKEKKRLKALSDELTTELEKIKVWFDCCRW